MMAVIAFDTLKCAQRLIDAGVPEKQAQVQVEVMAEAFVYNMDKLVTQEFLKEHLDARFSRHEAALEKRFARIDAKFRVVFWMLGILTTTSLILPLHLLLTGTLFTG